MTQSQNRTAAAGLSSPAAASSATLCKPRKTGIKYVKKMQIPRRTEDEMKELIIALDERWTSPDEATQKLLTSLANKSSIFNRANQNSLLEHWFTTDEELIRTFPGAHLQLLCRARGFVTDKDKDVMYETLRLGGDPRIAPGHEKNAGAMRGKTLEFDAKDWLRLMLVIVHPDLRHHLPKLAIKNVGRQTSTELDTVWFKRSKAWHDVAKKFFDANFKPENPVRVVIVNSSYDDSRDAAREAASANKTLSGLKPDLSRWAVEDINLIPLDVMKKRMRELRNMFHGVVDIADAIQYQVREVPKFRWFKFSTDSDRVSSTLDGNGVAQAACYTMYYALNKYEYVRHAVQAEVRKNSRAKKGVTETDDADDDDDVDEVEDEIDDVAAGSEVNVTVVEVGDEDKDKITDAEVGSEERNTNAEADGGGEEKDNDMAGDKQVEPTAPEVSEASKHNHTKIANPNSDSESVSSVRANSRARKKRRVDTYPVHLRTMSLEETADEYFSTAVKTQRRNLISQNRMLRVYEKGHEDLLDVLKKQGDAMEKQTKAMTQLGLQMAKLIETSCSHNADDD